MNLVMFPTRQASAALTLHPICHRTFVSLACCCLALANNSLSAADSLLLRDWTRISGVTVVAVNDQGIQLEDGRQFGWHEIEDGNIAEPHRAKFAELRDELADPMFRIRLRLARGDHAGLAELAESIDRLDGETTGPSALTFAAAKFHSLTRLDERPAALQYFLTAQAIVATEYSPAEQTLVKQELGLAWNQETGLSDTYPPLWLNVESVRACYPELKEFAAANELAGPVGRFIYMATFAIAADDLEQAEKYLEQVGSPSQELFEFTEVARWRLQLEREPRRSQVEFRNRVDQLLPRNRAFALYWLGCAGIELDSPAARMDAALLLLRIPAELAQYPELSAAGLYQTHQAFGYLGDRKGQQIIASELATNFPLSFANRRLLQQTTPTPR